MKVPKGTVAIASGIVISAIAVSLFLTQKRQDLLYSPAPLSPIHGQTGQCNACHAPWLNACESCHTGWKPVTNINCTTSFCHAPVRLTRQMNPEIAKLHHKASNCMECHKVHHRDNQRLPMNFVHPN